MKRALFSTAGSLSIFLLLAVAWLCYKIFIYVPSVDSFQDAKMVMEQHIVYDHRRTIYCDAEFDADKRILPFSGFYAEKYQNRAARVEWEHAVPVENFGRAFAAWSEGDKYCVRKDGKAYKGRRCAAETSQPFRKMEADMYNLFPSIGSVNAARGTRAYSELGDAPDAFGSCGVKIADRRFEPPDRAKGQLARASLYMEAEYREATGGRFRLSRQQRNLFMAWDRKFPVDAWECKRAKRIERIQKNENRFVKEPCIAAGLW